MLRITSLNSKTNFDVFCRNASGSKDRVKEGIDQVKEGMHHLIVGIIEQ